MLHSYNWDVIMNIALHHIEKKLNILRPLQKAVYIL